MRTPSGAAGERGDRADHVGAGLAADAAPRARRRRSSVHAGPRAAAEAPRRLAPGSASDVAGRECARSATAAQRPSCVVVEAVEQVDLAQVGAMTRSVARQVLVDERHGHRALADRAGHALDRARAHVAGHEHAGHAGLEQVGVALERPAARAVRVGRRRG